MLKYTLLVFCTLFLAISTAGADVQAQANQAASARVIFGVNGHPLVKNTYEISFDSQISLLKGIGFKTYRVNVSPANPSQSQQLAALTQIAERNNIQILPVIAIKPDRFASEDEAYNVSKKLTFKLASQFVGHIPVWELGNELDRICINRETDGTSPSDYDTEKYNIIRGVLRGMLEGLHEASPSFQSMVDTSRIVPNYVNSGFLERLIQDGVNFDITGYHFYSHDGHIPAAKDGRSALIPLYSLHKPIWISEFDQAGYNMVEGPNSRPREQARILRLELEEISAKAAQYNIIGADIYELLDQPLSSVSHPSMSQMGILTSNGESTDASIEVQKFLQAY